MTEVWLQNWLHIGGSTGVEGEDQGVKIALLVGVVVPMVYCGLFAMLNGSRTPPASARKASPNEGVGSMEWSEPPKGSSPSSAGVGSVQQTESRRISWTQVILPALIQAIGGIIVALIGALIGRSR